LHGTQGSDGVPAIIAKLVTIVSMLLLLLRLLLLLLLLLLLHRHHPVGFAVALVEMYVTNATDLVCCRLILKLKT
jgi:hypothetical protein